MSGRYDKSTGANSEASKNAMAEWKPKYAARIRLDDAGGLAVTTESAATGRQILDGNCVQDQLTGWCKCGSMTTFAAVTTEPSATGRQILDNCIQISRPDAQLNR
jgi:hypothetical protein